MYDEFENEEIFGSLVIYGYVALPDQARVKRVRLASTECYREGCKTRVEEFKKANPQFTDLLCEFTYRRFI